MWAVGATTATRATRPAASSACATRRPNVVLPAAGVAEARNASPSWSSAASSAARCHVRNGRPAGQPGSVLRADSALTRRGKLGADPDGDAMLRPVPRPYREVDVFTSEPYRGNPVGVVHDADGLGEAAMQRFANWTNFSETTFLLAPQAAGADYRVRIFTPDRELPFAGHPTLGTCHAWLEQGGAPRDAAAVVQECGAGLIPIRRAGEGLAFAAPPLVREGPVADADLDRALAALHLERGELVDAAWADNGPGWMALLLRDADAVLALKPDPLPPDLDVGVAGPHPGGEWEVRTFFPIDPITVEDPVTGSFNAGLAQWLIATGRATAPYTARQGTALGRAGRVRIDQDPDGTVWVGGGAVTCVTGDVRLSD